MIYTCIFLPTCIYLPTYLPTYRAVVEIEDIGVHPGVSFPKHTFGEQNTVASATWAVSMAGEKCAFLLILLDNVDHHSEKYILVTQNE